jgi:hypothetical protein
LFTERFGRVMRMILQHYCIDLDVFSDEARSGGDCILSPTILDSFPQPSMTIGSTVTFTVSTHPKLFIGNSTATRAVAQTIHFRTNIAER